MAYIGKQPAIGNFVKLDAISVVNGQAAYTMQNGGANFTEYSNVNQFLVSLNGILQSPTDSFTVSGSTITFASNLITGDVIDFIIVLGNSLDVGVPSDNTVSTAKIVDGAITSGKLASGAGGKIGQVITAVDTSVRTTTSSSFVTGSNTATLNITPSATSSKIFVVASGNMHTPDGDDGFSTTIYRTIGGSSTNLGDSSFGLANGNSAPGVSATYHPTTMSILDSPNTTSECTYQWYFRNINQDSDGTATASLGNNITGAGATPTHITAFEVLA